MSIDGIAAIVFILFLAVFLLLRRKRLEFQGIVPVFFIVMYKTSFGLKMMRSLAKRFPKTLRLLAMLGVVVGFIGMALICVQLVVSTADVFSGKAPPSVQPVLPFEAKGVFYVPFLYWIISIFLLALVHEFAHGIISNVYKVPVKSSGFAFLCLLVPVIPAAFVEPDEKVLKKKRMREQLGVFAAGPFSNIIFAAMMLVVILAASPVVASAWDNSGVEIARLTEKGPAIGAGLEVGDVVTRVGDVDVVDFSEFQGALRNASPNQNIAIETLSKNLTVSASAHPDNSSWAYLGVSAKQFSVPNDEFVAKYGSFSPGIIKWFAGLFFWLFLLNIGIGLFNLLPIGPVDGGRMFGLVCERYIKNKSLALKVWSFTSMFFIGIILFNLFAGFFV